MIFISVTSALNEVYIFTIYMEWISVLHLWPFDHKHIPEFATKLSMIDGFAANMTARY